MESSIRDYFACRVCAQLYRTQQEADLCTPAEMIPMRYPGTVAPTSKWDTSPYGGLAT